MHAQADLSNGLKGSKVHFLVTQNKRTARGLAKLKVD